MPSPDSLVLPRMGCPRQKRGRIPVRKGGAPGRKSTTWTRWALMPLRTKIQSSVGHRATLGKGQSGIRNPPPTGVATLCGEAAASHPARGGEHSTQPMRHGLGSGHTLSAGSGPEIVPSVNAKQSTIPRGWGDREQRSGLGAAVVGDACPQPPPGHRR